MDRKARLDGLATHRVKVNTISGTKDASLGELILIVSEGYTESGITPEDAARELRLTGFKTDGEHIYIANKSEPIKKILAGTPWASEWARPLKDIYKAESTDTIYFSPGINSRATMLP